MRWLIVLVLLLSNERANAADQRQSNCSHTSSVRLSQVRLETGLVIVPFAIPVAVPVATVAVPSVLYSYQRYGRPNDFRRAAPPQPTGNSAKTNGEEPTVSGLLQRCATCHQGPSAKGNLRIFKDDGRLYDQLPRHRIYKMVASGKMPPEGSGLEPFDADERRRILEWVLDLPDDVAY